MVVSIDVEVDVGAAVDMLQNGLDDLVEGLTEALDQAGADMVDAAQSMAPVRTGFLRDSIHYEVDGLTLVFEAAAPYAKFVEYGHAARSGWKVKGRVVGHVPPHPFMRPSFYEVLPQLQDALAAAAANAFQ